MLDTLSKLLNLFEARIVRDGLAELLAHRTRQGGARNLRGAALR